VDLISSSIQLITKYDKTKTELSCSCSPSKANKIRSIFPDFIRQYPQIWFSIAFPNDFGQAYLTFSKNIGNEIYVSFGSLLSTSKFLVHDIPFNGRTQWTMTFPNEHKLIIKHEDPDNRYSSIVLTLSMECINKNILVIDGNTHLDIILSIDSMTREVQEYDNKKSSRYLENLFFSLDLKLIFVCLDYMVIIQ